VAPKAERGGAEAALPQVLSAADADRYARIFDLQRDGNWDAADRLIRQLETEVLLGHVLFQRYMHPTAYRSAYHELKDWMEAYADHPGATRIYALAQRRRPAGHAAPPPPRAVELPEMDAVARAAPAEDEMGVRGEEPESQRYAGKSAGERARIRAVERQVRSLVQRGSVTIALERLSSPANKALFDPVSYADSLGVIARGYYRYHYDDKALAAAAEAAKIAGDRAARAHWWGGLAAFRQGDYPLAAQHFHALSDSPEAEAQLRAAGGYWASRAFLRGGRPEMVSFSLMRAANAPRSFYGLLATRALGSQPALNFDLPALGATDIELLMRIEAAQRAIALIEAGQPDLADAELRRFVDELPPSMSGLLLALADRTGLADMAFRLGRDLERSRGTQLDGALYPLPSWAPMEGFEVDRALIFAIVRQESQFRTRAISYAGARGLMQLMPATAGYMADRPFHGAARAELFDPGLNLSLGQKYVRYVLDMDGVGGNLLRTLVAYNAGPGNLQKWEAKYEYSGDPLLFIESLPSRETRNYIEHVLANFWIYRYRLGQEPVSMDHIIAGDWPRYIAQDGAVSALLTPVVAE
jgi:soluble lytic murein transglycosylase-like protein